jgi:large subunit ribosomal protein L47
MTQRGIKQVLTERYYSWKNAETVAKDDPEITFSGDGPVYNPRDFDDELLEEEYEPEEAIQALEEPTTKAESTAHSIPKIATEIAPKASPEVKSEVRPGV